MVVVAGLGAWGPAATAAEAPAAADSAPAVIPFPNGSFDQGEACWFFSRERGVQTRATAEFFHTAPGALRVLADTDKKIMARVDSPFVPVKGPGIVELRYKVCGFAGRHLNHTVRQYDAERKYLAGLDNWGEDGDTGGKWATGLREVLLDAKTAYIQLRFLPTPQPGETIDVFFDDFEVVRPVMPIPPWTGQYKLKPTDKLTAADIAGPDGIVYPNWTQVGVQGGIPDVPVVVKLANLGAKPDSDIADLLDQACREAGQKGGGAVLIGEGTFRMSHPVTIRDNGVVIRGMGKDKTKLVYDNPVGQPGTDVGIYWPRPGAPAGPDTVVEAHVYNIGLKSFKMFVNDKEVATTSSNDYQPDRQAKGAELIKLAGLGEVTLRVEATYMDGHVAKAERKLTLTDQPQAVKGSPSMKTLLFFVGAGLAAGELKLAEDGKRGDTVLVLADAGDLKVGDKIELHAPGTPRWQKIIQHTVGGDDWKRIAFDEVKARDGNRITLGQPLRIDYPVIDGTYLRKVRMIERNGVENLAIEHLSRLPLNSIEFDWGWNGWVRHVKVVKSGSCAFHGYRSKWLEVRDCEFDGAWQFDGGQAYSGFTSSHDSLYENTVVKKHRHAPVVQYGANGNVFRNSTFEDSDLQWHAGWSTENLFENCVVKSTAKHGSYGYGAYATGSSDTGHGPNGPRNVVYNCDLSGIKEGVQLNGVNEGWIFVHNRIVNEKGAGFSVTRGSFDHTVRNNVFVVKDATAPMTLLATPDCVGTDLVGNTLVGGNGAIAAGAAKPALEKDNKALPAGQTPERPKAAIPSIYEWQKQNRPAK